MGLGIEDFVIEQIAQDFAAQQQLQPQMPVGMPGSEAQRTQASGSSFFRDAAYGGQLSQNGLPPGAEATRSYRSGGDAGFSIADPAQRAQYSAFQGRQNANVATDRSNQAMARETDQNKFKVLESLKGLDPQIQGAILKRLGIDPGAVKSTLQNQQELARFKRELETPDRDADNARQLLSVHQAGQQKQAELQQKKDQAQQEQTGRAGAQQIQMMRFLAELIKNDTSGQAGQTLGPVLMQMLQQSGINLAPPKTPPAANSRGRRITQVP